MNIKIERLDANPDNARQAPKTAVKRLAKMLAVSGWISPLQVVATGKRYTLVAGHCRLAAAQLLNAQAAKRGEKPPWPALPCEVLERDALALDIVNGAENLGRSNLNIYERGKLFHGLKSRHGLTNAEIGERFALGAMTVGNELRVFEQIAPECVEGISKMVDRGLPRRQINGILRAMVDGKKSHQEQIAYLEKLGEDGGEKSERKKKPAKASADPRDDSPVDDPITTFLRALDKLPPSNARKAALLAARFMYGGKRSPIKQIAKLGEK